jgi:hypothetical protein
MCAHFFGGTNSLIGSFTTMEWTAVSEEPAELADYRETLWMVPDVQSFPEAVADINFAQGAYRIEITDSDNGLLEERLPGILDGARPPVPPAA